MSKRQVINAFVLVLLAFGGILSVVFFPVAKGRYQYHKFLSTLELGMTRTEVVRVADSIGYEYHDIEVRGKGIVPSEKGIPFGQFDDVYSFRNVLLNSVVIVEYDSDGVVVKVFHDQ